VSSSKSATTHSGNVDLVEFENMAQTFYEAMSQYYR